MLSYNDVKLVNIFTSDKKCINLLIDNMPWAYDIKHFNYECLYITKLHNTPWTTRNNKTTYELKMILPLNIDNPKETIDKFFKLLVLQ